MLPATGKSFDPTRMPKAVKDAGFTPGEIEITALGSLARKDGLLVLEMSGAVMQFVLVGGPKEEELGRQKDILGKHVRVAGKLHPSHRDRPPSITVERFQITAQ